MGEANVAVIRGNILNVLSEAIVLPANTALREGSGVSTAIFQAAGRKQLTEACRKIGSCEEGRAVVTPGFDLKADYIIHTVVPRWIDGQHGEYERLCASYLAALNVAVPAWTLTVTLHGRALDPVCAEDVHVHQLGVTHELKRDLAHLVQRVHGQTALFLQLPADRQADRKRQLNQGAHVHAEPENGAGRTEEWRVHVCGQGGRFGAAVSGRPDAPPTPS